MGSTLKPLSDNDTLRLHKPFCDMLDDTHVYQKIHEVLEKVAHNVKQTEDEIIKCFQEMNNNCSATIDAFKQGIDDRNYYKDKLADYGRIKHLIDKIQEASKDFLDAWILVLAE